MDYATVSGELGRVDDQLIVIPVDASELVKTGKGKAKKAPPKGQLTLHTFDPNLGQIAIEPILKSGFKGKDLQASLIRYNRDGILVPVLFVGWEKDKSDLFTQYSRFRWLGNVIVEHATRLGVSSAILSSHLLNLSDRDALTALVEGCELSTYRFEKYKSKSKEKKSDKEEQSRGLKKLSIHGARKLHLETINAAKEVCAATALARDLINTPGADC